MDERVFFFFLRCMCLNIDGYMYVCCNNLFWACLRNQTGMENLSTCIDSFCLYVKRITIFKSYRFMHFYMMMMMMLKVTMVMQRQFYIWGVSCSNHLVNWFSAVASLHLQNREVWNKGTLIMKLEAKTRTCLVNINPWDESCSGWYPKSA